MASIVSSNLLRQVKSDKSMQSELTAPDSASVILLQFLDTPGNSLNVATAEIPAPTEQNVSLRGVEVSFANLASTQRAFPCNDNQEPEKNPVFDPALAAQGSNSHDTLSCIQYRQVRAPQPQMQACLPIRSSNGGDASSPVVTAVVKLPGQLKGLNTHAHDAKTEAFVRARDSSSSSASSMPASPFACATNIDWTPKQVPEERPKHRSDTRDKVKHSRNDIHSSCVDAAGKWDKACQQERKSVSQLQLPTSPFAQVIKIEWNPKAERNRKSRPQPATTDDDAMSSKVGRQAQLCIDGALDTGRDAVAQAVTAVRERNRERARRRAMRHAAVAEGKAKVQEWLTATNSRKSAAMRTSRDPDHHQTEWNGDTPGNAAVPKRREGSGNPWWSAILSCYRA